MDKFLKRTPVEYPIGLESTTLEDYGISGIPHAFVVNQAGKIIWHGHPAEAENGKSHFEVLKRSEIGAEAAVLCCLRCQEHARPKSNPLGVMGIGTVQC